MPLRFTIRARAPSGEVLEEQGRAARAHDVEVPLPPEGIVFGRAPGVTIALPFAEVSARHARIVRESEGFRVEDLGSSNGTRLAGRRLPPRTPTVLAFGDLIEIGGVAIRFEGESRGAPSVAAALGTQTLARRLVHDLFELGPPAQPARLVVLSGPEQGRAVVLAASGRAYVIGRAEGCDLVLSDEDVSREHAAVERGAGGFAIRDLGSKNGVEVGGAYIAGERQLADGEIIRVGETRLRFTDPEDRYLRQLEAAAGGGEAAASVVEPAQVVTPGPPPSRLPAVATALAVTVLLAALGLVLALAFVPHL